MPKYSFKFHYEKKPDEIVTWRDTDSIYEPFKAYSNKIKENRDELIFYYKGVSFKYRDCEKNETFMNDLFYQIDPNNNINIIVFPIKKKKQLSQSRKKLGSLNESQDLNTALVTLNSIKEEKENKEKDKDKDKEKNEKKANEKEFYNDILCPKCLTSSIIENDGLNINIINCDNFHRISRVEYDRFEFIETYSSLQCGACHVYKSKLTPPEDQFYYCICGNYLCPTCFKSHSKEHNKVKIEDKNYKCVMHNRDFTSYCLDCNINICDSCNDKHNDHEILKYQHLRPKDNYIEKITKEVEEHKKSLNNFIDNSKKLFDNIMIEVEDYINKYIILEKTLLNRFKNNSINFQLLQNLRNKKLFYENNIFKYLQTFNKFNNENNNDNINNLNYFISNVYRPIINAKKDVKPQEEAPKVNSKNEMTITYKVKEKGINKFVKLFDSVFVDNNKDRLTLTIDGKEQKQLIEYFNNAANKDEINVKIVEKKPVTNMSFMFNNCKCLDSINFQKWDTTNITNMESLFQLCPLETIPDISRWNTSNLTNMRAMFCKCIKLKTIPEMSKWQTINVKDMSLLFNGCISIESIPKFPKWNTQNVEDMSYMFSRCIKLKDLHNLGKLNTSKVRNMCGIFNRCEELTQIPDISSWNMNNVTDISIIFQFCSKVEKITDIYKWQFNKLKDISGVFSECTALKTLPKSINWNTSSIESMCGLFNECNSLTDLPDISKWITSNCTDMSGMFCGCNSLSKLPNLSGWDTSNVTDMSYMFDGCSELKDISSILNWDMKNVEDKTDALKGCSKLNNNEVDKWLEKKKI